MCAKRRQQCRRKIRVEVEIFQQFREAQEFRLHVCAAQPERCFAPVLDSERRTKLFLSDISSGIIVGESHVLQVPCFSRRPVRSAPPDVTHQDIVVRVLLQHLHVIERVLAETKILNKPGPQVGSIAKNLALNIPRRTGVRF